MAQSPFTATTPELSIVVPALNEERNVAALVEQVQREVVEAGVSCELIVVDDGSSDATLARLEELGQTRPWVRALHRDKPMGQSAAMYAGIQAARGPFIATLDADLQNDPADLPRLLKILRENQVDFVQGCRTRRKDTVVRRCTSWVGRSTRKMILGDLIRDTGCSTRVVRAEIARQLPLHFKGMHRFMPVYARMLGATVMEASVNHRPRLAGVTKYGILNRGLVGLFDCLAMRWMIRRYRNPRCAIIGEGSRDRPTEPSS